MKKTIGIIGGMGSEATAELFHRIIKATPAESDQDHFRIIIDNNPDIPDRTKAILHEGPTPLPEMLKSGELLKMAKVDFILIPCNTAHYFYEQLIESLDVPILHMIKIAAETVAEKFNQTKSVGLIATDGTIKSGIYQKEFKYHDIEIIQPRDDTQRKVMKAIYDYIKKGELEKGGKIIQGICGELEKMGAETIICGCTEISLVLKDGDLNLPVIDPLQVLAEKAVELASTQETLKGV
jgi:aspartate racemase